VFYLLMMVSGGLATGARRGLVVGGSAVATATNILAHQSRYTAAFSGDALVVAAYLGVAGAFYQLFKPVSRAMSATAACFALTGCAVQAFALTFELAPITLLGPASYLGVIPLDQRQALAYLFLKLYSQAYGVAIIFFAFYCLLVGYMAFRSTFIPRFVGAAMMFAGAVWMTFLAPVVAAQYASYIVLAGIGEAVFALWLLVKGVDAVKWNQRSQVGQLLLVPLAILCVPGVAAAQSTGVLIGLAARGDIHWFPDRFRTLWVTVQGQSARAQSLEGLRVPATNGFRTAWIDRRCSRPGDDQRCEDSLRVRPSTAGEPHLRRASAEHACTVDRITVGFASPSMVSLETRAWLSDCAHHGFSDIYDAYARPWTRDTAIAFGTLGPGAAAALERASDSARNHGSGLDTPEQQDEDCRATAHEQDWHVVRHVDRWAATYFEQRGSELCQLIGSIDWPLPATVIGVSEPAADSAEVASVVGAFEVIFVSPDQSLAVIIRGDTISIHPMDGKRPRAGSPIYSIARAPDTDVIMVQWAYGAAVARWSSIFGR
jgi:hypothetical protein